MTDQIETPEHAATHALIEMPGSGSLAPPAPITDTPVETTDETKPQNGDLTNEPNALERLATALHPFANNQARVARCGGVVTEIHRTHYTVSGLSKSVHLGQHVSIENNGQTHLGEVISIQPDTVTVKPFTELESSGLGQVAWVNSGLTLAPHPSWKGRVLNARGEPIDAGDELLEGDVPYAVDQEPPAPMFREKISTAIKTGVRVIDVFSPICAGQRIGIFAGSGVGKSSLLSMLAHGNDFDTIVVALVGERGREVREFIDTAVAGKRAQTVSVVASGAESAMMRRLAPKTAMCIAEYFRDKGEKVLLIIDSITRFAHASRDVALAAGEPPVARGYTPSVFSDLPKLLERAGTGVEGQGSITGIFTVLVDADDHNDPIADSVRGILDGHIVLDRAIADSGRYPPVNILASVSRLAEIAWTPEQHQLVMRLRSLVARYEETRDLRAMGAYKPGADPELDQAIALVPRILHGLNQLKGTPLSRDAFQDLAQHLAVENSAPQQQ